MILPRYLLSLQVRCHLHLFLCIQDTVAVHIVLGKDGFNLRIRVTTAVRQQK